jgi:hypothetical protein
MTKHLTHKQFSNQFLDEFLDSAYTDQNPCTRILGTIFKAHRKEVAEHLESCLEYMDMEIVNGYGGTTHEHVGYNFHKGFRQIDPIDAPLLNGIVWTCIGNSDLFWETMNDISTIHDNGVEKVSKPLDTLAD